MNDPQQFLAEHLKLTRRFFLGMGTVCMAVGGDRSSAQSAEPSAPELVKAGCLAGTGRQAWRVNARVRETTFKPDFKEASMDFRPLAEVERRQLIAALRGNADRDRAILMDRRNTSFVGTTDDVPDEEVIRCIQSVPCHY